MTSLALIRVCMLALVVGRLVWSTGRAARVIPGEVVQVESSTREPLKVLIEPTESGVSTILLLVGRWVASRPCPPAQTADSGPHATARVPSSRGSNRAPWHETPEASYPVSRLLGCASPAYRSPGYRSAGYRSRPPRWSLTRKWNISRAPTAPFQPASQNRSDGAVVRIKRV